MRCILAMKVMSGRRKVTRTKMSKRYRKSEALLKRALRTVPLGTQTFSKSKTQYPWGVSPYFLTRGRGSHVWDVDGNQYIDFNNALAAITLGYNDPDVTRMVQAQLKKGALFSLPHPIEIEVSEKIVEMVPCAEMVRFGKNGSDATSGAIRLARAYTGRDHVAACGYHGWQDWYIGSTSMNRGVPTAVQKLTHVFQYNDLDSLERILKRFPNQVAAVILEPMNSVFPKKGYLQEVKRLTKRHGAILIFDETITGFRFAKGGAQEYFNVTPDLATFGKGLANGYPLSAIAGRRHVMRLLERVFFSFTFGGETLSLAAAFATLQKLQHNRVIEHLSIQGTRIQQGVKHVLMKYNLHDFIQITGHPAWSFLKFKQIKPYTEYEVKTFFLQEVFHRGLLTLGTHNLSYSHTRDDIDKTLHCYEEVFSLIQRAIKTRSLRRYIRCRPLKPLFTVR
jgi:glutamate-1-semialdehyde 2,1-aminomutase